MIVAPEGAPVLGADVAMIVLQERLRSEPVGSANFPPARFLDIEVFMAGQETPVSKKRGPKPTGWGTAVMLRLQPDDLHALDAWIASQPDTPSRPEAVRRLMREALR